MSEIIRGVLVFYIDVGQLPPVEAEIFVDRNETRLNKLLNRLREQGYENIFLPIRQPGQTRVEVLSLGD